MNNLDQKLMTEQPTVKRATAAAFGTLPGFVSMVLIRTLQISPEAVIYDGSPAIFVRNLALICCGLYLLVVFLALGDLLGFFAIDLGDHFSPTDRLVIGMFGGASLVTLVGAALGVLGLLNPFLL